MDIQNIFSMVPYKRNSYKVTVFRYVFFLIVILFVAFGAYTYYDYQKECQSNAGREAQTKAARIVSQNDERLENLRQYYITMSSNDSIKWMLENNIRYSDYSNYKKAYEDMGSEGIFSDYVGSFTFVNFRTGWVLSNKGLFPLYETYNQDTVMSIYEDKTAIAEKNYWKYDEQGVVLDSNVDRKYRLTVETNGLNFIMRLPATSYNTYAVFIANVNMDTWNDLPEDVQNIISEVGEGYLDYESEYINTIHEEDIKALEEQGCTVTTLSREEQEKWAASLPDVVNGLVKSLDDAGYNGSEIVEDYYEILESQGVERVRDWKISE